MSVDQNSASRAPIVFLAFYCCVALTRLSWLSGELAAGVCRSPLLQPRGCRFSPPHPAFSRGFWALNSGPHACMSGTGYQLSHLIGLSLSVFCVAKGGSQGGPGEQTADERLLCEQLWLLVSVACGSLSGCDSQAGFFVTIGIYRVAPPSLFKTGLLGSVRTIPSLQPGHGDFITFFRATNPGHAPFMSPGCPSTE